MTAKNINIILHIIKDRYQELADAYGCDIGVKESKENSSSHGCFLIIIGHSKRRGIFIEATPVYNRKWAPAYTIHPNVTMLLCLRVIKLPRRQPIEDYIKDNYVCQEFRYLPLWKGEGDEISP